MASEKELHIMFTCAGRRVALLEAFRRARAQLGLGGKIIATDITSASPSLHKADVGLLVPTANQDNYIPALLDHVARLGVKLLVPLTDVDLMLLALNRHKFADLGCTVMVGSEQAIALCQDKTRTNDLLTRSSLPAVRTVTLEEFSRQPFFPCFVKPIRGSAGVGTATIYSDRELQAHVAVYGSRLMVQECLHGQEYTIDIYRGRDGQVRCVVPRQRLVVRSGEVEKGITVNDAGLIDAAMRVAKLVDGLWGVFCCQCRRNSGEDQPHFFEINPRFGGGVPLSIAAGADLPLYLLQEVLGLPITAKVGEFTDKLLMLRYDDALFVRADSPQLLPGYSSPHFR